MRPDTIDGHDVRSVKRSMDLIFAEWANRGVHLFEVDFQTQSLAPGQTNFLLPLGTIDVLDMARRTVAADGTTSDVTLNRISEGEYLSITQKNQTGMPTQFWVQRIQSPVCYIWQPPADGVTSVVYYRLKQFQDTGAPFNNPDIPYRWQNALTAALSVKVAMKELQGEELQLRLPILQQEAESSFNIASMEERERGNVKLAVNLSAYSMRYR